MLKIIVAAIWGWFSTLLFIFAWGFAIAVIIHLIAMIRGKGKLGYNIKWFFLLLGGMVIMDLILRFGFPFLRDHNFGLTKTEKIIYWIVSILTGIKNINDIIKMLRDTWENANDPY